MTKEQVTTVGLVKVFWHGYGDWGVWLFWEDDREETNLGGTMVRYCRITSPKIQIIPPGLPMSHQDCIVLTEEPPEDLVLLVKHFHETKAVMPLLDRLLEVYPELEPYTVGVLA